ncbi:hypothetical protein [Treponema endosymbiont of Eucomonympha sp.]|uniref:hypothetical protein n=1 Tax=Treponema endosymbiont of Eucomonympha sp. TaxID=1580831 RepID=UPI0007815802|nr:hypothetical protein [Treponema endosymbiont of Eucomonympha sp.]
MAVDLSGIAFILSAVALAGCYAAYSPYWGAYLCGRVFGAAFRRKAAKPPDSTAERAGNGSSDQEQL